MTTAPAERIVAQIKSNADAADKAGLGGPAVDAFNAEVIRLVSESPDPEATIGELAQLLTREYGKASACPLYRDCAATGPHYDHSSHDALKVLDETGRETLLDAGMVANSGPDMHAIVYLRQAEFTDAVSVRAKTAELRSFLDQVDAMADRVFADHKGRA
jgi:hypothetical protein